MEYVIAKVRGKDGQNKDKRKGRKGVVELLELGNPMLFRYTEREGTLRTTPVEAYSPADKFTESSIVIQTENSIYVLKRVKEDA